MNRVVSISLVVKAASVLLGLLTTVVAARLLSPGEFGLFSFGMAVGSVGSVLTQAGTPTALVRVVNSSDGVSIAERDQAVRILIWRFVLIGGVLLLLAMPLAYWFLSTRRGTAAIFGCGIAFSAGLTSILAAILRAREVIIRGLIGDQILPAAGFIVVLIALGLLSARGFPIELDGNASLVLRWATSIAFLPLLVLWVIEERRQYLWPRPKSLISTIASTADGSGVLFLATALQVVASRADFFLLAFYATDSELGSYRIARLMAEVVSLPLIAATLVLGPAIARSREAADLGHVRSAVKIAFVLSLVGAGIVIVSFSWFGRSLLGPGYEQAVLLALPLLLAQVVAAMIGPVVTLAIIARKPAVVAASSGASLAVMVLLGVLLAPGFDALGVSVASAISTCIWAYLMVRYTDDIGGRAVSIFGR